jgi:hypothetical protein
VTPKKKNQNHNSLRTLELAMDPQALPPQDRDYRTRLKEFQCLDNERNALVEVDLPPKVGVLTKRLIMFVFKLVLERLDTVTAELEAVINEKAQDVSKLMADLESEKKVRLIWQEEVKVLDGRLSAMVSHSQPSPNF